MKRLVYLFATLMLLGCTVTKYVPVPEVHDHHHYHTDSVIKHDSTHSEKKTVIRELDSAAMAQYGIQMANQQKAWLVHEQEMNWQIQQLMQLVQDRDTVHDSIPQPYPVEVIKEVPAQLSWIQSAKLHLANAVLWLIAIVVVIYIGKGFFKL